MMKRNNGEGTMRRNRPIAKLIRWYCNKQSGHVTEARQEIQRRFDGLDWTHQKKIVEAFLASTKSDRTWMYKNLLDLWDDSFEPQVRELWEQYHEERCAWVVIRHFEYDYIMSHLNELANGRNYFFICQRFASSNDFIIDSRLLKPMDSLIVHAYSGKAVSDEKVLDMLFKLVRECCLVVDAQEIKDHGDEPFAHVLLFERMRQGLYYARKMNAGDAIERITQWDKDVMQTICTNPEHLAMLNKGQISDKYRFGTAYFHVAAKYAFMALDDKYKRSDDPNPETILGVFRPFYEFYMRPGKLLPRFDFKNGFQDNLKDPDEIEEQNIFNPSSEENVPF